MPEKPIVLPLVETIAVGFGDNPNLIGSSSPATLTVQLDTLGGQIYQLQLSERAAIGLLAMLSSWQPILDYLSGQAPNEPPKIQ